MKRLAFGYKIIQMNNTTLSALRDKILAGHKITKPESIALIDADLTSLRAAADEIRNHFCGDKFDICTIVNAKSGKCTENCKWCAQSKFHKTGVKEYPLLDSTALTKEALYNHSKGILRYSIVSSGRKLSDAEIDQVCASFKAIGAACDISLCASVGLINYEQFVKLKSAGVSRYHNNLETSRRHFPNLCTTHTYDDKVSAIKDAQRAGLVVCSGGIMGMGETWEDRIDLALDIRELGIKSTPVNFLQPITGTALENQKPLSADEGLRILAIYRFILPDSAIRLAGGRNIFDDKGKAAFGSGANAAISGDMLTTLGTNIDDDMKLIYELGYKAEKI